MERLFQEVSSSAESKGCASFAVSQIVFACQTPKHQVEIMHKNKGKNSVALGTIMQKRNEQIMMASDVPQLFKQFT